MDRERLQRIRNWQSDDWYAALVMRPICILVMLVIADWRWLSPNALTSLGNLCKLAAAALIVPGWGDAVGLGEPGATVAAVVLLQLGLLFDHLDGTVARYRRAFSSFGSVYDKTSDMATWFLISLALGWRGYVATGDVLLIVLATASAYALAVRGYAKWLIVVEREKLRWHEAALDPAAAVARHTAPPRISPPPERTAAEWARWFARMMVQVYRFEEVDLFFWVGLGLLLDRVVWLIWLLFVTQVATGLAVLAYRHLEAHRVDRALGRDGGKPAQPDAPLAASHETV